MGAIHPEEQEDFAIPSYNVIEISIEEEGELAYARVVVFHREVLAVSTTHLSKRMAVRTSTKGSRFYMLRAQGRRRIGTTWTMATADASATVRPESQSEMVAVPGTTVTSQPTCARQRRMFHFMPKSMATTCFVGRAVRQHVVRERPEPLVPGNACGDHLSRDRGRPCRANARLVHQGGVVEVGRREDAVHRPRTRSRRTRARVSMPSMPMTLLVSGSRRGVLWLNGSCCGTRESSRTMNPATCARLDS